MNDIREDILKAIGAEMIAENDLEFLLMDKGHESHDIEGFCSYRTESSGIGRFVHSRARP